MQCFRVFSLSRNNISPLWIALYSWTTAFPHLPHESTWPTQFWGDDPHGSTATHSCSWIDLCGKLPISLRTYKRRIMSVSLSSKHEHNTFLIFKDMACMLKSFGIIIFYMILGWDGGKNRFIFIIFELFIHSQLLNMERLNLYSASLRVCFLLFEKMREHLKFQLEVSLLKYVT